VGIKVEHATDWYALNWYAIGTQNDGIVVRDSASFSATNIRADFAGPGAGGQFSGLHVINVDMATFMNVSATDNNAQGILVNSGGSDLQFIGGWVRDNGQDSSLEDYYRTGMTVAGNVKYVTVSGMHFLNSAGTSQQYGMLDIGPTHTVLGNTFHDNTKASVRNVDTDAIMGYNRGAE